MAKGGKHVPKRGDMPGHRTGMQTIMPMKKGQHKMTFKAGGLHASTGTPPGKKIPAAKRAAARSGALGRKAQKQELFAENVLVGRKGRGK